MLAAKVSQDDLLPVIAVCDLPEHNFSLQLKDVLMICVIFVTF